MEEKKREVLLHLSREKQIENQERIYNHHARLLPSEPLVGDASKVYSVRRSRHLHEISFRSYAYREEGRVKINQWPQPVLKIRPAA